jgi:glycosyltransferase involved in cell wall biosynthesis
MNILLLSEVSAERVLGGAERVLREQARTLRIRGHHVSIVARAPFPEANGMTKVDGIDEYRYPVSRRHELGFVLSSIVGSLRSFDRATSNCSPTAVVIHQSLAGLGPVLARGHHRFVYLCLSLAHEEYLTRNRPSTHAAARVRYAVNAKARFWTERLTIRRCAAVLVLSEFMSRRVRSFHGIASDKVRLIPGAVDIERFRPPPNRAARDAIRKRLGLPENTDVLFTVRNLVPRMGLPALLEAVPLMRQGGHDLVLLIGGEGPLRPELAAMIERLGLANHVRLVGFVPESTLPEYYQAADLVLLPTHELEGFGLVTVEALACGTPVVGTPVGAIPEVLGRIDPALITGGCDPVSLATSIGRMLRRFHRYPGEQERLSAVGRRLVEKEYTWSRHSEQLEAVLQATIGSS